MSDVFTINKIAVFSLLDMMTFYFYIINNNGILSVVRTCFKRMACSVLYRFQNEFKIKLHIFMEE